MSLYTNDKLAIPIARSAKSDIVGVKLDKKSDSSYKNDDHEYIPIPFLSKNQRSATFISGPSGSGKSSVAANMVKELFKIVKPIYPENKRMYVHLITGNSNKDPAFKDIPFLNTINIKQKLKEYAELTAE